MRNSILATLYGLCAVTASPVYDSNAVVKAVPQVAATETAAVPSATALDAPATTGPPQHCCLVYGRFAQLDNWYNSSVTATMYTAITEYYEDENGATTSTATRTVTNHTVADYISSHRDTLWAQTDDGIIYYPDPELRMSHYAYGRSTIVMNSVATVSQTLTVTSPTAYVHEAALRILEVPPETKSTSDGYCPQALVDDYLGAGIGLEDDSRVFTSVELTAAVPPFIASDSQAPGISYIPQDAMSTMAMDDRIAQEYPGITTCVPARVTGEPGLAIPLSVLTVQSTTRYKVGQAAPP